METSIWRALFYLVGIMAFAALNAAYLVWCERKGAARIQRRSGPTEVGYEGLLQPLADGLKLMSKQLLVPRSVDGIIFRLAPVLAMIPGITSMVVIPFSGNIQARAMELSLLLIFALASLGMIAILLGGWASGNKYAIISSARAVSQNLAYEIPMLLTAITVVMISGSIRLITTCMCGLVMRLVSMTTTALNVIPRFLQSFRRFRRKAALFSRTSSKELSLT